MPTIYRVYYISSYGKSPELIARFRYFTDAESFVDSMTKPELYEIRRAQEPWVIS